MSNGQKGVIVGPDEGRALSVGGDTYTEKVLGQNTNGAYTAMVLTVRSSEAPPRHVHADFEEAFYVLEGEWEFEMDGKTSRAPPGTFFLFLRGTAHTFYPISQPARIFKIISPPGFEKFFEEIDGETDLNRIADISTRHSVEFLDPPPA